MLKTIKAKLILSFLFVIAVIICFGLVVIVKTGGVSKDTVTFVESYWATADLIMETRITFDEISHAMSHPSPEMDREQFIAKSTTDLMDMRNRFPDSALDKTISRKITDQIDLVIAALADPVRQMGLPAKKMEEADAAVKPLLQRLEQDRKTRLTNLVWEGVMAFNDILITNDPNEKIAFDQTIAKIENDPDFAGLSSIYIPFKKKALEVFSSANKLIEARNTFSENGEALAELLGQAEKQFEGDVVDPATLALLDDLKGTQTILIAGLLLTVIIALLIGVLIANHLSAPLKQAVAMLESMEKGRISQRLKLHSKDEIGRMAKAMNSFADCLETEIVVPLQLLAQGDLTFNVQPRDEHDLLRTALNKLCDDLNRTMNTLQDAGTQINAGACQVADSSTTLSQGATESAASLEEISASMNEISSQTNVSAENANQANMLSDEARKAAEEGSKRMEEMVIAMGEINEAGQNISKIIKVIDEIAFQTNLLALNAAVEAARAGQHGKGFAVVAEEVRNLAARSAKAAEETAELIEGSVEKATNGTMVAEKTAEALEEVVSGITKVSDLVSEIAAASSEQAQGIGQVNQGLAQIDQVIQQNTASAEESAATSEELAGQSGQLANMLNRFVLAGSNSDGTLIRWTGELDTGIPDIDQQHRRLVDLINQLFTSMREGNNKTEIARVVDELVNYTDTHFSFEEELMRSHGYPGYSEHQRIHQSFVAQINQFATKIKGEEHLAAADVFSFLKDWLISHIKKQDIEGYAPMIRK